MKKRDLMRPRRGIYILPNMFTTASLFAGFYAVVSAIRGDFDHAAMAIFVAMLMDTLDGRVARLTNTQSNFGAAYDSLADMVSFGMTPALVLYTWGLFSLGRAGWLAAFFYTAATALRLARFNTSAGGKDKRFFYGLPCTAAAGVVGGMIWVFHDYGVPGHRLWWLAALVTLVSGGLQLSTIRYSSFKDLNVRSRAPFIAVLAVLLFFMFISIDPPLILWGSFVVYAISGPCMLYKPLQRYFGWDKVVPVKDVKHH